MWPFRTKPDASPTLTGRVDDLERAVRGLTTEWVDTLEKVQTLMGRLAKRDARARPEEPAEADPPPARPVGSSGTLDVVALRRSRSARPGGG